MPNTPDRNHNVGQIMVNHTHDGGPGVYYQQVTLTNNAPFQNIVAASLTTGTLATWTVGTTTGTVLDINMAALTTGIGIDISSAPVVTMGINFTEGTASTIDPSATAETGWINVGVAGTVRYIPYYAAA